MTETNTTARFTLHVPMCYPGGQVVAAAELETIEAELLEIAPGFTRHEAMGKRKVEGNIRAEHLLVYTVDVEEGPTAGVAVQKLARRVAAMLEQERVYVTFSAVHGSYVAL